MEGIWVDAEFLGLSCFAGFVKCHWRFTQFYGTTAFVVCTAVAIYVVRVLGKWSCGVYSWIDLPGRYNEQPAF
jgi:cell division protein FtsW (lipid II flippase)